MKIAIVGMASGPRTFEDIPPEFKIWGLNAWQHIATTPAARDRTDLVFQVHPPDTLSRGERKWLDGLDAGDWNTPTMVAENMLGRYADEWPEAAARDLFAVFPASVVRSRFPGGWFANTFCLELALAAVYNARTVALQGVELLSPGRELAIERPATAYWFGVIHALGMELLIDSKTLAPYVPIYGVDYWDEAHVAAVLTQRAIPDKRVYGQVNLDSVEAVERLFERLHDVPWDMRPTTHDA